MNVDDVYMTLHYHWMTDNSTFADGRQRLQIAFLVLISSYTGSRPWALVYVERNITVAKTAALIQDTSPEEEQDEEDSVDEHSNSKAIDPESAKTICYEDVTLLILPNPKGERDLLAMEVNLQYTKGHQNRPKR